MTYKLITISTILLFISLIVHLCLKITVHSILIKLFFALCTGIIGYLLTVYLIPILSPYLYKRGIKGKDLGRIGKTNENDEIPSALGLISGIIFLIMIILIQIIDANTSYELIQYNICLQCITFIILLGFSDDVLDLPWRFKLLLPLLSSLPLICTYNGETSISIPIFMRDIFYNYDTSEVTLMGSLLQFIHISIDNYGSIMNLGLLYYIYISMLCIFCTNSINIYAGINGLEVGQSIIIGISILYTNIYSLQYAIDTTHPHLISAIIMCSFIGTSLALLKYNWYPARIFVGDTYCYYAGITLAIVCIMGHFTKTLLIFLLPQIFNFLYSCPQLFKYYPCPRHRLPNVDKDGLRVPSTFTTADGKVYPNMTLICLVLRFTGPITEELLCIILLILQLLVCGIGLFLREYLAYILY